MKIFNSPYKRFWYSVAILIAMSTKRDPLSHMCINRWGMDAEIESSYRFKLPNANALLYLCPGFNAIQ